MSDFCVWRTARGIDGLVRVCQLQLNISTVLISSDLGELELVVDSESFISLGQC